MRWLRALGVVVVAGWAGVAHAERPRPLKLDVSPFAVPPGLLPASRLIYMHRCPSNGCTVTQGPDDSRIDQSMIAQGTRTIGAFTQSDAVWDALMVCMRATYAPFDIGITDVNPGSAPHYEHLVGGRANQLRDDIGGAGGVSPFTCAEIPNAITYTFDVYGPDAEQLCWTAAQETAHAFGLEHETNTMDPLTYLGSPPKRFQAAEASCGEFAPRACDCGGTTQNTYAHLLEMFGPGVPTAPMVTIKAPASGKRVQPHFVTKVDATDDVAIDRVELYVDGAKVGEAKMPPYWIAAPDLAEGPHAVEARAFDVQGTPASATIDVDLGPPCTASKGCEGDDVCVMGLCVAGPDTPGGLGSFCQAPTECLSMQCVEATDGKFCVESCDVATPGACPSGFFCLSTGGDAGVCWQSEGGGCCDAGGRGGRSAAPPLLLGAGVLALVLRRRRRA